MSSLLPLGDTHADQTNRLRRHHAAEAAQGALTVLRAHCLPANVDTDQVHGPREVAELMTFSDAKRAGVGAVSYQMSARRKIRDADTRERARYVASVA